MPDPAGRHRRRLHRRHRPVQHAGAQRHAHGAADRRARARARRARGRRGRGGAQVAHRPGRPRRWRKSLAAQRWLAGAGCAPVPVQVLLDLRQHRRGQYRPGRRRAARRAGRRLHHRLPGFPRDRPHHLQGPPVRRRPAALRHPHASPSADADDRRQPGPRAAAADRPQGRAGAVRRGPAAVRTRSAPASRTCARPAAPTPSPTCSRTRICAGWARPAPSWPC